MSLATVDDLDLRLPSPIEPGDELRAQTLLDDASALVRGYTRQDFDLVEDDQVVLRPVGTVCRLPQRPVQNVTAVTALSGSSIIPDLPLGPGMFTWDGSDKVDIWPGWQTTIINLPETWLDGELVDTYRITYSHGYAEVPADVIAVVTAMVSRVLLSPSPVEGLVSERIGQYNYQLQQGSGAAGASVRMTSADRSALERYRRTSHTIQVGTS